MRRSSFYVAGLVGWVAVLCAMPRDAHAITAVPDFTITFEQVGSDVVANGSGTIDLDGLTYVGTSFSVAGVVPSFGTVVDGSAGGASLDFYTGFTGPSNFGSGGTTPASSGSGDQVGIYGKGQYVAVPAGYVSGTTLSDTMTFDNATFASLGLTPGTYVFSWNPVADPTFTVQVGVAATPLPAALPLFTTALAGLGLLGWRRKRKAQAVA